MKITERESIVQVREKRRKLWLEREPGRKGDPDHPSVK